MKRAKQLIFAAAITLSFCLGSHQGFGAEKQKIGVVNIQDIIDSVEEGRKAKEQMEKTILQRKKDLDRKQKEYKRLEESFEKQKLVLSPAALAEKQQELQAKKMELQKHFLEAQTEMQKKEFSLTGDLLKKIRSVVAKVGQEGGYSLILEKGQVEFYKDSYDITKQVIKDYNKIYKKK